MEPLKPETESRILEENPEAAPEDIQEYEQLLSERFTVDPDLPMGPEEATSLHDDREQRLQQLYIKIFKKGPFGSSLMDNRENGEVVE